MQEIQGKKTLKSAQVTQLVSTELGLEIRLSRNLVRAPAAIAASPENLSAVQISGPIQDLLSQKVWPGAQQSELIYAEV